MGTGQKGYWSYRLLRCHALEEQPVLLTSEETPAFPVFMEITLSTKYFSLWRWWGTKSRVLGHVRQVFPEHCLFPQTQNTFLPPSSSRMTILSSYKWELHVVSFSSHFNILAIVIFLFLKVWEVLNLFWPQTIINPNMYTENTENCFQNLEFLITPVG